MKTADICTNIANEEDRDILTRPLFAVNLRLLKTSPGYRRLVEAACQYIADCCLNENNGMPSYLGYSGANAGIPWDIIAAKEGTGVRVMINTTLFPSYGARMVNNLESCGSIPSLQATYVPRLTEINIRYHDLTGKEKVENHVTGAEGGFVIQHEVDHNDGILLTDRISS